MFQRGTGLAVEKRQAPVIEVSMAGTTPPPRSKEGTHPGRISHVRNTETPTKSSPAWWWAGRPTVRNAETFGGMGMSNKQKPVGESQRETGSRLWATPPGSQRADNWPDTGRAWSGPERAQTWTGEPVKTNSQNRRNRRTS
jgi:hypothetical protein